MAINGVIRIGKTVGGIVGKTPNSSVVQDILKIDVTILETLFLSAQKNKTGIFKSTPWNCTAREMQEVGTKLAYKDILHSKIQSLYAKYSTETKVLKMNGSDREFTIFRGSKSGSNEGYWAQANKSGELYYIKYGSDAQMRSEQLAGDLYELGGIPSTQKCIVSFKVPKKSVFDKDVEKIGVASKFMPINCLPDSYDAAIVREGFGMDCWLANWDGLKSGNVVMSAGNAARLDVGGSLCFRARGGRKGVAFGENVNELTSFFEDYSHSKPFIKEMTREDLISSLGRVSSIPDNKIIETINKAAQYKTKPLGYNPTTGLIDRSGTHVVAEGIKNPEYLKEIMISRKNYISKFRQQCIKMPQQQGETIEEYIRRIDGSLDKIKYEIPFEKIEMSTEITDGIKGISMAERLTPTQKQLYEDSYRAFKISSKNKIIHNDKGNIISPDSILHATSYENLDDILTKGITTGDLRGNIGTGTGCATQTPLCADFWDVNGKYTIKDYFTRQHYNPGEANFLPRITPGGLSNTRNAMVFVVNKNNVAPTIMKNSFRVSQGEFGSILYKDSNMAGHSNYITHRAIPIGVPANTIEKIIIRKEGYSAEAIQQIKDSIKSKGLNISLYDLEGNLL